MKGLIEGAHFVGAKPLQLQEGGSFISFFGKGKNDGTIKDERKGMDKFVRGSANTKGEMRSARAGGVLGGLLGAAIGAGALVFTGLIALGKAAAKGINSLQKSVQEKTDRNIGKQINLYVKQCKNENKEPWSLENMEGKGSKIASAFKEFIKADELLANTREVIRINPKDHEAKVLEYKEKLISGFVIRYSIKELQVNEIPKFSDLKVGFTQIPGFNQNPLYSQDDEIGGENPYHEGNIGSNQSAPLSNPQKLDEAKKFIKANIKNLDGNNNNVLHHIMNQVKSLEVYKAC